MSTYGVLAFEITEDSKINISCRLLNDKTVSINLGELLNGSFLIDNPNSLESEDKRRGITSNIQCFKQEESSEEQKIPFEEQPVEESSATSTETSDESKVSNIIDLLSSVISSTKAPPVSGNSSEVQKGRQDYLEKDENILENEKKEKEEKTRDTVNTIMGIISGLSEENKKIDTSNASTVAEPDNTAAVASEIIAAKAADAFADAADKKIEADNAAKEAELLKVSAADKIKNLFKIKKKD